MSWPWNLVLWVIPLAQSLSALQFRDLTLQLVLWFLQYIHLIQIYLKLWPCNFFFLPKFFFSLPPSSSFLFFSLPSPPYNLFYSLLPSLHILTFLFLVPPPLYILPISLSPLPTLFLSLSLPVLILSFPSPYYSFLSYSPFIHYSLLTSSPPHTLFLNYSLNPPPHILPSLPLPPYINSFSLPSSLHSSFLSPSP